MIDAESEAQSFEALPVGFWTKTPAGVFILILSVWIISSLLAVSIISICGVVGGRGLMIVIALGSLGGGGLLGLINGSVGKEQDSFKTLVAALNGLFSGAAITESVKPNGTIRVFLRSLAAACGTPEQIGLVTIEVIGFAAMGFIWMYVARTFFFTRFRQRLEDQLESAKEQIKAIAAIPPPQIGAHEDGGMFGTYSAADRVTQEGLSDETMEAAATVVKNLTIDRSSSLEDIKLAAHAYYLQENYPAAEKLLRRARTLASEDPSVLMELAYTLINMNRQAEAIPIAKQLVKMTTAPQCALRTTRLCWHVGRSAGCGDCGQ